MIYAPLVLLTVLVSTRSRAEWIPDVSEISDSFVDQSPLADNKGRLRGHDFTTDESDEERAGTPHADPEFLASLMRKGESSADPLAPNVGSSIPSLMKGKSVLASNVPNKDLSHLKSNIAFTERMEQLEINIDDVAAAVQTLQPRERLSKYNDYTLTLMALGNEYFKKVESSGIKFKPEHPKKLKKDMTDYLNSKKFVATLTDSRVSVQKMYGKLLWLAEMGDFNMSDKEDLAEMAFGSEFFSANNIELNLPSSIQGGDKIETLDQLKHQVEQLAKENDVDPKVIDKLRVLADDPDSIGKTKKEILGRARDAVLDDVVDRLKSNEAFTQRMENLEIDIDGVKVAAQSLRKQPGLLKYDDYSLYWMALGSEYFKKLELDGVKFESVHNIYFRRAMGNYATSREYKKWADERKHSLAKIVGKFYGKIHWLKRDEHLKLLNDDDLVNMAFGSELFPAYKIEVNVPSPIQGGDKIETLDQLKHQIEQMAKQNVVDPKVIDKLRALADDPDSIGKTEKEILKRARDAVLDDVVDHLKSKIAFTQRMEDLEINIDGVKVAAQSLRKQPGLLKYDDYSLYWMALGSEYFKKLELDGVKFESVHNKYFHRAMGNYATSREYKKWADKRKHSLAKIAGKFYGKIHWLKRDEHLKLLNDDDLVNMAFGSELFPAYKIEVNVPSPIQGGDKIETLDQLKHQIEQMAKRDDVDPKLIAKLRALAEDPGSIGKTKKEILKRERDAVLDDELDRLKSNEAFTQRMEELKINIDDLNGPMQRLREQVGHLKYDEYSLYLMALGSEYFKNVGVNIKSLQKNQFISDMNEYATSNGFKRWKEARKYLLRGRLENFYGKMRLLKHDEHLKLLKGDELANMAFGSELSKISESKLTPLPPIEDEEKIETLDQLNRLINQLPSGGNGEPNVKKSLEDILKKDPKAFIGQTANQLKRKAEHEALGVALGEETNKKPHVE